jgi:hypothetical protein
MKPELGFGVTRPDMDMRRFFAFVSNKRTHGRVPSAGQLAFAAIPPQTRPFDTPACRATP